jgi:hypothetical protein
MALGLTQPLTKMITRNLPGGTKQPVLVGKPKERDTTKTQPYMKRILKCSLEILDGGRGKWLGMSNGYIS